MERVSAATHPHHLIVEKLGTSQVIEAAQLSDFTGVPYLPHLQFASYRLYMKVTSRKKIRLSADRLWLSAFFKQEILHGHMPPVRLRFIDEQIGWGVFAEKDLAPMEFIAEYSGIVRSRSKHDFKNAYCFEYLLAPDEDTPYLIDAQDQGGLARYINHHPQPNLASTFTLVDHIPHIIVYTVKAVQKGEQLFYDYGPGYWKKRAAPVIF